MRKLKVVCEHGLLLTYAVIIEQAYMYESS